MRYIPALLLLSACYSMINVNGFEIRESDWASDEPVIRNRASFDLQCPTGQISLVILAEERGWARDVGAEGCGKRTVYKNTYSGWALNGPISQAE